MSFRTLTLFQTPDGLNDDWLLTWSRIVEEFKRRDGSPVTRRDLAMYNSIRLHFNGKHERRILDVATGVFGAQIALKEYILQRD